MTKSICLIFFLSAALLFGQSKEYVFKSIFLSKFSNFIEWPESTFSATQEFVIGVYGENGYKNTLEKVYAAKQIQSHPVKIHYLKSIDEVKGCHIVIINAVSLNDLKTIIDLSKTHYFLTIGNTRDIALKGAILGFYVTADETIHFSINEKAMKESPLKINFMLLEVADVIKENK